MNSSTIANNEPAQSIAVHGGSAARTQRPAVIWFTGLSGSGKTTSARLLKKQLVSMGCRVYMLDGDILRAGLCSDLGFSERDRNENIRRAGELAKSMLDAGYIVLVSLISPFLAGREMVRQLFKTGEFIEVYVSTPIEVCEVRDVKGLYKKARSGSLTNFTGIDSPYQPPEQPDVEINTQVMGRREVLDHLMIYMKQSKVI